MISKINCMFMEMQEATSESYHLCLTGTLATQASLAIRFYNVVGNVRVFASTVLLMFALFHDTVIRK